MKAYIKAISYYLPGKAITNDDLAREFPDLKIDDLTRLTGVKKRYVAEENETAADLAYNAALKGVSLNQYINYAIKQEIASSDPE